MPVLPALRLRTRRAVPRLTSRTLVVERHNAAVEARMQTANALPDLVLATLAQRPQPRRFPILTRPPANVEETTRIARARSENALAADAPSRGVDFSLERCIHTVV